MPKVTILMTCPECGEEIPVTLSSPGLGEDDGNITVEQIDTPIELTINNSFAKAFSGDDASETD